MTDTVLNFSWLAVIVGAIAAFFLGYFWYSPKMFGTNWAKGNGFEMDDQIPVGAMVVHGIGLIMVSWFIGIALGAGLMKAVLLAAIGFTIMYVASHMYSQRSSFVRWVDAGYWLASLAIILIVHSIL